MARNSLDAAGRALVSSSILGGDSNDAIRGKLEAAGYPALADSTLTHYRAKLLPEIERRDLAARSQGATSPSERLEAIVASLGSLQRYAIEGGEVKDTKGALLALKFVAELEGQAAALLKILVDRVDRREARELQAAQFERRMKLAEDAAALAREKWEAEKALAARELELFDKQEAAVLGEDDPEEEATQ